MRSKAKVFLVVICSVIMVTWLVPWSNLFGKQRGGTVKIFGKAVPADRMLALEHTLYALTPARQRRDTQRLAAQAGDALILDEEARRYGISASDADVAEFIQRRFTPPAGVPVAQDPYGAFLEDSRISASEFESSLKVLLTGSQLLQAVRSSVTLPSDEAWLWYGRDKERVKAAYIELRADDLAPLVPLDEKALNAFYEQHKEVLPDKAPDGVGYLEPKQVKIEYILCRYQPYLAKAVITPEQIASYYEAHKDQYLGPKVEGKPPPAAKPLAEVKSEIESSLRKAEAERAVDEVMKAVGDAVSNATDVPFGSPEEPVADFAAIAKAHGLTCEVSPLFSAKEVEAVLPGANELATKAFTIHELVPSRPLAARDGKFIFQIPHNGIVDEHPAPFEKVRARVEADYRREKGFALAVELASAEQGAPNLDAAAAKLETEIANLLKARPAAKEEEKGKERGKPPADPKAYFKRGESEFFSRPQEFPQFPGVKWSFAIGMPGNFNYGHFAEAAFAVEDGKVALALEPVDARAAYLLMRVDVEPADRTAFEKDKAKIVQDFLGRKQDAVLRTWLADVRRRANPSGEGMQNFASDEM